MSRDEIVLMLTARGFNVLPELTEEDRLLKIKEVNERVKYRAPLIKNISEDEQNIKLEEAMERMYSKGNKID